VFDEETIFDKF